MTTDDPMVPRQRRHAARQDQDADPGARDRFGAERRLAASAEPAADRPGHLRPGGPRPAATGKPQKAPASSSAADRQRMHSTVAQRMSDPAAQPTPIFVRLPPPRKSATREHRLIITDAPESM
jgi:hypothetical protein